MQYFVDVEKVPCWRHLMAFFDQPLMGQQHQSKQFVLQDLHFSFQILNPSKKKSSNIEKRAAEHLKVACM